MLRGKVGGTAIDMMSTNLSRINFKGSCYPWINSIRIKEETAMANIKIKNLEDYFWNLFCIYFG